MRITVRQVLELLATSPDPAALVHEYPFLEEDAALRGCHRPSVVLLRVQKLNAAGQAALIRTIWEVCEQMLADGAAVSADNASIRVRRLPLR